MLWTRLLRTVSSWNAFYHTKHHDTLFEKDLTTCQPFLAHGSFGCCEVTECCGGGFLRTESRWMDFLFATHYQHHHHDTPRRSLHDVWPLLLELEVCLCALLLTVRDRTRCTGVNQRWLASASAPGFSLVIGLWSCVGGESVRGVP